MPEQYLYLMVNLCTISIPFIASFYPRAKFVSTWKRILPALTIPLVLFIIWDIIFTERGVWGFNPRYLSGSYILNLPIEEWLFFVTVPYACLFTYFALKYLKPIDFDASKIAIGLGIAVLITGLLYNQQAYTFTTFVSLGLILIVLGFQRKPYLSQFFVSYMITLIPFFIVNGVLTGSWIEEQVVWYNDLENFGLRMGTIPVEDALYGMLLLLLNTMIWEEFGPSNQSE